LLRLKLLKRLLQFDLAQQQVVLQLLNLFLLRGYILPEVLEFLS